MFSLSNGAKRQKCVYSRGVQKRWRLGSSRVHCTPQHKSSLFFRSSVTKFSFTLRFTNWAPGKGSGVFHFPFISLIIFLLCCSGCKVPAIFLLLRDGFPGGDGLHVVQLIWRYKVPWFLLQWEVPWLIVTSYHNQNRHKCAHKKESLHRWESQIMLQLG